MKVRDQRRPYEYFSSYSGYTRELARKVVSPFLLVICDIMPQHRTKYSVLSFRLNVRLRMVRRGINVLYTQQRHDSWRNFAIS